MNTATIPAAVFDRINPDIALLILDYLTNTDLQQSTAVINHYWNKLSFNNRLWCNRIIQLNSYSSNPLQQYKSPNSYNYINQLQLTTVLTSIELLSIIQLFTNITVLTIIEENLTQIIQLSNTMQDNNSWINRLTVLNLKFSINNTDTTTGLSSIRLLEQFSTAINTINNNSKLTALELQLTPFIDSNRLSTVLTQFKSIEKLIIHINNGLYNSKLEYIDNLLFGLIELPQLIGLRIVYQYIPLQPESESESIQFLQNLTKLKSLQQLSIENLSKTTTIANLHSHCIVNPMDLLQLTELQYLHLNEAIINIDSIITVIKQHPTINAINLPTISVNNKQLIQLLSIKQIEAFSNNNNNSIINLPGCSYISNLHWINSNNMIQLPPIDSSDRIELITKLTAIDNNNLKLNSKLIQTQSLLITAATAATVPMDMELDSIPMDISSPTVVILDSNINRSTTSYFSNLPSDLLRSIMNYLSNNELHQSTSTINHYWHSINYSLLTWINRSVVLNTNNQLINNQPQSLNYISTTIWNTSITTIDEATVLSNELIHLRSLQCNESNLSLLLDTGNNNWSNNLQSLNIRFTCGNNFNQPGLSSSILINRLITRNYLNKLIELDLQLTPFLSSELINTVISNSSNLIKLSLRINNNVYRSKHEYIDSLLLSISELKYLLELTVEYQYVAIGNNQSIEPQPILNNLYLLNQLEYLTINNTAAISNINQSIAVSGVPAAAPAAQLPIKSTDLLSFNQLKSLNLHDALIDYNTLIPVIKQLKSINSINLLSHSNKLNLDQLIELIEIETINTINIDCCDSDTINELMPLLAISKYSQQKSIIQLPIDQFNRQLLINTLKPIIDSDTDSDSDIDSNNKLSYSPSLVSTNINSSSNSRSLSYSVNQTNSSPNITPDSRNRLLSDDLTINGLEN